LDGGTTDRRRSERRARGGKADQRRARAKPRSAFVREQRLGRDREGSGAGAARSAVVGGSPSERPATLGPAAGRARDGHVPWLLYEHRGGQYHIGARVGNRPDPQEPDL